MKKFSLVIVVVSIFALLVTGCSKKANQDATHDYKYYTAEEVKTKIENGDDIILLDIQVEEEWEAHHIKGAIPTHAFPVKTDEDKAKLDEVIPTLEDSEAQIIIICPRGGGGASNTYDYLIEKGIDEDRLYTLEKGQSEWPYDELLED